MLYYTILYYAVLCYAMLGARRAMLTDAVVAPQRLANGVG